MSPTSSSSSAVSGGVSGSGVAAAANSSAGEFMLFGVRVVVDSMRKSVSMNNLSQYEHPNESSNNNAAGADKEDAPTGYASADDAVKHSSGGSRDRKRGVPWTEAEHKLFLLGLQKVGKGDWRGISRNFVKTRTPTQVASHAQKYFLRRTNLNRRRRRSSLFDITTDSVSATIPMDEDKDNASLSLPLPPTPSEACNGGRFRVVSPYSGTIFADPRGNPMSLGQVDEANNAVANVLLVANRSDINLNLKSPVDDPSPQLSLRLSLSCDQRESSPGHSAFQAMPGFNNGESIISVA